MGLRNFSAVIKSDISSFLVLTRLTPDKSGGLNRSTQHSARTRLALKTNVPLAVGTNNTAVASSQYDSRWRYSQPKTQTASRERPFLLRSLGKGKLFVIRFQVEEDTVLFVTDHRVKVASGIGAF